MQTLEYFTIQGKKIAPREFYCYKLIIFTCQYHSKSYMHAHQICLQQWEADRQLNFILSNLDEMYVYTVFKENPDLSSSNQSSASSRAAPA